MSGTAIRTVHALKMVCRDDNGPLPNQSDFWRFLIQHAGLMPQYRTIQRNSVEELEISIVGTQGGVLGTLSRTQMDAIGKRRNLQTRVSDELNLTYEEGINFECHFMWWDFSRLSGTGRTPMGILFFESTANTGRYTAFEELLNDAVHTRGWTVSLYPIEDPNPESQLYQQVEYGSVEISVGIQPHVTNLATGLADLAITPDMGDTIVTAKLMATTVKGGRAKWSIDTILGYLHQLRNRPQRLLKFKVPARHGQILDLLQGIIRYRLKLNRVAGRSGAVNSAHAWAMLNDTFHKNRSTFTHLFGRRWTDPTKADVIDGSTRTTLATR